MAHKIIINMKKLYSIFLTLLFLVMFSINTNAQCSITGSVIASSLTCGTNPLNACAGVLNIGDETTLTEFNIDKDFSLECLGPIHLVIKNNATLSFNPSGKLRLAYGSSIDIETGSTLAADPCNASERVYIGGVLFATCDGNGGADWSFGGLSSIGGTGNATSNSPVKLGDLINLMATPPSIGGPYTYDWYEPAVSTSNSIGTTPNLSFTASSLGEHFYEVKMHSTSLNITMKTQTSVVVSPLLAVSKIEINPKTTISVAKSKISITAQNINSESLYEIIDKVIIYDLQGKQIYKKEKVNAKELTIQNLVSSKQSLIVKVSFQNGGILTKKIIF
jgi:trimeric autotransporter adhesin